MTAIELYMIKTATGMPGGSGFFNRTAAKATGAAKPTAPARPSATGATVKGTGMDKGGTTGVPAKVKPTVAPASAPSGGGTPEAYQKAMQAAGGTDHVAADGKGADGRKGKGVDAIEAQGDKKTESAKNREENAKAEGGGGDRLSRMKEFASKNKGKIAGGAALAAGLGGAAYLYGKHRQRQEDQEKQASYYYDETDYLLSLV